MKPNNWTQPRWEPSEQEIAAACAEIRAGWSPGERLRRGRWMVPEPVTVQSVSIDELDDAAA